MKPEALIASIANLPAPAPSVARLLELLARADADNEDMIRVIRSDGVMSAKLLGLCNSAGYGLAAPIGSIEQAVLMLGHAEIHRLVMSVGFSRALNPALIGYGIRDGELWRHSLLTAYVAVTVAALSRRTDLDPAIAYTAGLVHDIGKIVITQVLDMPRQQALRDLIGSGQASMLEAERSVLGTDHAEVGACLLQKWGLPPILIEAVANHHQPVTQPGPKLSALVHVADVIALEAGTAPGWGSYAMRPDEAAVTALGLDRENIENLIISACDSLERVDGMLAVA